MAILSFLLFSSDSAPHHSDVSLGTRVFEFMKVFRFEEERRMYNISRAPHHPNNTAVLTYFCTITVRDFDAKNPSRQIKQKTILKGWSVSLVLENTFISFVRV